MPPHVFCLLADGVTYARVRRTSRAGFAEARHFRYPGGLARRPRPRARRSLTREAIAEAVKAARALAGGPARRAPRSSSPTPGRGSCRSSSRRCPTDRRRPGRDGPLEAEEAPARAPRRSSRSPTSRCRCSRTRSASSSRRRRATTIEAIERAFEEPGVRVGYLAPASLALFEGLAPSLAAAAAGDYALLHRSARRALVLHRARGGEPIFFRPAAARGRRRGPRPRGAPLALLLRGEAEGPGPLGRLRPRRARPGGELAEGDRVPRRRRARSRAALLGADAGFDERVAARPELLAGFAAVYGEPMSATLELRAASRSGTTGPSSWRPSVLVARRRWCCSSPTSGSSPSYRREVADTRARDRRARGRASARADEKARRGEGGARPAYKLSALAEESRGLSRIVGRAALLLDDAARAPREDAAARRRRSRTCSRASTRTARSGSSMQLVARKPRRASSRRSPRSRRTRRSTAVELQHARPQPGGRPFSRERRIHVPSVSSTVRPAETRR